MTGILGIVGPLAIIVMLTLFGLLSRRLGRVTNARSYYVGFFIAAMLIGISVVTRFYFLLCEPVCIAFNLMWQTLILDGFPAIGMTMGVLLAWRYWSWLLAERD